MKITIYNYNDKPIRVKVPDNVSITKIHVEVVSGDEIVTIYLNDGNTVFEDSGKCSRLMNFYDGCYDVLGDNILKWINFKSSPDAITCAYERMNIFMGLDGSNE